MKKLVITGGPCSGKSTTIAAIKQQFDGKIMVVPEAATILLSGGFPLPGRDLTWSQSWQAAFQTAIVQLQLSLEEACTLKALESGAKLLVCDRGILDGAAYTPGGTKAFCLIHNLNHHHILKQYQTVIHLESLATARPELYGQTGNNCRFESLEKARELEIKTRAAWQNHPRHQILSGDQCLDISLHEIFVQIRLLI